MLTVFKQSLSPRPSLNRSLTLSLSLSLSLRISLSPSLSPSLILNPKSSLSLSLRKVKININ